MLPPYVSADGLDAFILHALAEDVGSGDVTTLATIPEAKQARATFLLKEDGVFAGRYVAGRVFALVDGDLRVAWAASEGQPCPAGTRLGTVEGAARSILVAERLALNLLQRMGGIATETRRYVEAVAGTGARVLDTRKTAPGLRALDKWAVRLGGGTNHRVGLWDRILIKDNHVEAAGGVSEAIRAAAAWRDGHRPGLEIECEARTLAEAEAAAGTGLVNYILLDNMVDVSETGAVDVSRLAQAVECVGGRARTEASGGITLATARRVAETGVDFLSVGALTHSVRALDLSLKIGLG